MEIDAPLIVRPAESRSPADSSSHHSPASTSITEPNFKPEGLESGPVSVNAEPEVEEEIWEESSDDEDEDLEPMSADGIRRRKRKPGQRIRPAYYYPVPADDAKHTKGVPVFEPTMEEFEDFYE